MALYIPAGRRRRAKIVIAAVALAAGLLLGVAVGRLTAGTVDDRIADVHSEVERTVAGLRVISLHESADTAGSQTSDGGTALVLDRTESELRDEFEDAAWLRIEDLDPLLDQLTDLRALDADGSAGFGDAAEALAAAIERTFGLTPRSS